MNVPVKKGKLQNLAFEEIDKTKSPEELNPAETNPEIIPFEDPFESPEDAAPVPGEGP
ncbi:hypothetical protein SAMN05421813_10116 [Daejeonella rubra]|uniref:Serine endopeptidase inhibitors n=1 Tax=Daejeonella rubra TaxID=990371 RepID=A0A1G9LNH7_9SPHI|nr:hypothetical protein [Daejeonella rubra]SDL63480.1 hypothetical protein SAMN05421813_10116 [Daejeonella rubra]